MLLTSFSYFVLLFTAFIIFYAVPDKKKWIVLLLGSLIFVGWLSFNILIFTLIFAVLNYFFGIILENSKTKIIRKRLYSVFIFINVGILAFYKYINFFIDNLNSILSLFPSESQMTHINIIIPIGISYYTFQSIGNLILIYRGTEKAESNIGIYTLLLIFFPKFLSGPVERSNHFFPQVRNLKSFNPQIVTSGFRLFLFGMFKKVVIANNMSEIVFNTYDNVHLYTGFPLITTLLIQAIYLYCDFSGYTDMALGSAKIFGIDLMPNFNRPFLAKNVTEFWKRWHMSLSLWCNDYIFKPLMIKYRAWGNNAAIFSVFVTFIIIGIWHGANWTFVILGLLQGIAITFEFLTKKQRFKIYKKLPKELVLWTGRGLTYVFFSLSLVFFYSNNVNDAIYFIAHLFSDFTIAFSGYSIVSDKETFTFALVLFVIIFLFEVFSEYGGNILKIINKLPKSIRWSGYYLMVALIYYFSNNQETFVYLQF
jgi:D-alanyl-lipoteichoic acid acyltransferase DltB (MBOAT superfamily)